MTSYLNFLHDNRDNHRVLLRARSKTPNCQCTQVSDHWNAKKSN